MFIRAPPKAQKARINMNKCMLVFKHSTNQCCQNRPAHKKLMLFETEKSVSRVHKKYIFPLCFSYKLFHALKLSNNEFYVDNPSQSCCGSSLSRSGPIKNVSKNRAPAR
jgi:hypothetical protein